jgi:predicted ATPase
MVAASETQVVVETHSEHVINGMRLASMLGYIQHTDILVNFLHLDKGSRKPSVTAIQVDKIGDLTDFPPGFFDQSAQDLIQLSKIRRQNR